MGRRATGFRLNGLLIAGVVYGALAAIGLAYDAAVRRRYPPRGRMVETVDGTRHVTEAGRGDVLVLLHGANGNATDFPEALISELARHFRVIVPDRPGHGHSRRSITGRLDLSGEARAVISLLDALGVQRAHLLGHSYGGALVLRTALDAPDRIAGVLAVAPIGRVTGSTRIWVGLSGLGRFADAAVLALGVPVGRFASPGTRADAWHPAPVPGGWSASRAFPLSPIQIQASLGNLAALEGDLARLTEDLKAASLVAHVMVGEGDRITPSRENAAPLARAGRLTLETFPESGHWLVRTHIEQVASAARGIARKSRTV